MIMVEKKLKQCPVGIHHISHTQIVMTFVATCIITQIFMWQKYYVFI